MMSLFLWLAWTTRDDAKGAAFGRPKCGPFVGRPAGSDIGISVESMATHPNRNFGSFLGDPESASNNGPWRGRIPRLRYGNLETKFCRSRLTWMKQEMGFEQKGWGKRVAPFGAGHMTSEIRGHRQNGVWMPLPKEERVAK
jgi:hypothetical protein